jgi:phage shock protein A
MFKQFVTLIRGTAQEQTEAVLAPHGQTILRQQIRDCAQALASARYALAVAEAQHKMEVQQFERILTRITDLETRTIDAVAQGKNALATEAAESIALLEAERDVSLKAQDNFTREITRLKTVIRNASFRLKELEHGEKLTAATAKAQRLRERGQGSAFSTFKEAEETLARLKTRQTQFDFTMDALDELEMENNPLTIAEKLAANGCGPAIKTTAADVLKRLAERNTAAA